jgi:integrase
VADGQSLGTAAETVEHLCLRWLDSRIDVRKVTRDGYRQWMAPIMRHPIASKAVADVGIADVQNLVTWLGREGMRPRKDRQSGSPLSVNSIRSVRVVLQQVFDLALAEGTVTRNVVKLARWPKAVVTNGNDLQHWPIIGTGDDARCPAVEKFRDHADTDSLGAAWRLTLTGVTRSEICGLRWDDIDLENGTASITQGRVALDDGTTEVNEPKSAQRYRVVPFEQIHPGTTALFKRLKAKQAADRLAAGAAWRNSGFVVVDELGDPLRPEVYSDRFRRMCSAAGVPVIRLHNVRHTIALLLKLSGKPPWVGAGLLGHSVEVHEKTYARGYAAPGMQAAADSLGSAFASRPEQRVDAAEV